TGVQTCALPICARGSPAGDRGRPERGADWRRRRRRARSPGEDGSCAAWQAPAGILLIWVAGVFLPSGRAILRFMRLSLRFFIPLFLSIGSIAYAVVTLFVTLHL